MPPRIGFSGKLTKVCCVVGIGWWLTLDLTRADPPFVTDGPEPPPPGGWEINVPFILEHTRAKRRRSGLASISITDCSSLRNERRLYLRSKNSPTMAKTATAGRCQEAVSWKNKMPAMAIIAAPPAKMARTAESGPPLKKKKKRNCAGDHANPGQRRVIESGHAEFLIPSTG